LTASVSRSDLLKVTVIALTEEELIQLLDDRGYAEMLVRSLREDPDSPAFERITAIVDSYLDTAENISTADRYDLIVSLLHFLDVAAAEHDELAERRLQRAKVIEAGGSQYKNFLEANKRSQEYLQAIQQAQQSGATDGQPSMEIKEVAKIASKLNRPAAAGFIADMVGNLGFSGDYRGMWKLASYTFLDVMNYGTTEKKLTYFANLTASISYAARLDPAETEDCLAKFGLDKNKINSFAENYKRLVHSNPGILKAHPHIVINTISNLYTLIASLGTGDGNGDATERTMRQLSAMAVETAKITAPEQPAVYVLSQIFGDFFGREGVAPEDHEKIKRELFGGTFASGSELVTEMQENGYQVYNRVAAIRFLEGVIKPLTSND
jgi:hypothetical protein